MKPPSPCARLIETVDWAATSLGDRTSWSPALRALVATMLASRQPMLLFWGPDLVQLYNDAFVPSFGQGKHPAAMGQPARECWADAWPVVGAQIETVMRDGEPAWFADALVPIHRNGRMEEVFWTYSYSPAYDEHGAVAGTLVIVTEMTDRVLSARRLGALATLGQALGDAGNREMIWDALGATVRAEPQDVPFACVREQRAAIAITPFAEGLAPEAVPALPAPEHGEPVRLPSPVRAGPWPEPVTHVFSLELPARGTGRAWIVFGLSPRLPCDEAYQAYLRQIAEQLSAAIRRVDHALAEHAAERERDDLLMRAPVAMALLTGPEHVYQLANPRYRTLAGRDPSGLPFVEAFPEAVGSPFHEALARVYRTGEPFSEGAAPGRLPGPDGGPRYFNYTIEPMRDASDEVLGVMVVVVDVSEQVRASRAKDEFLAMLGHELRNPLAPIATAVELMKRKDTVTSREQETIERQLSHVVRLVDDLLDVSRISRGTITLSRRPLSVAEVVAKGIETAAPLVEQRQHRLEVEVDPTLVVQGDAVRLAQVITNLVTNAARYTPPGGSIRVLGEGRGDEVVIRVIDDGAGMEPQLLDRVFDLFVQGQRGIDRSEGGLGIGLAIVKNLVELHGGKVAARSDGPGRGSELVVTLPRSEDTAAAPRASKPPLPRVARARRVVIVDDNEDAALMLGELLRAAGHAASVALDAQSGLRLIRESSPDVAVLDIGLPEMDGYELAKRVRALGTDIRLIALTGYGSEKDRARALAEGFDAHLVKPVEIETLMSLIGSARD